jgi:hypothetical protein
MCYIYVNIYVTFAYKCNIYVTFIRVTEMSIMYTPGKASNGETYIRTLAFGQQRWQFDPPDQLIQHVRDRTYPFIHYQHLNWNLKSGCLVSVVMTTHNRQEQTLYTLNTLCQHDQVVVILVDDSDNGYLSETQLMTYHLPIVYITIESQRKTWLNPCINFNIGFQEVNTPFVIIQNAEVCHVGDVIKYVTEHLTDNNYLIFDVVATHNPTINCLIRGLDYQSLMTFLEGHTVEHDVKWIQHRRWPRNLHNLVALTVGNLRRMGGFDHRFAYASCFDDDEWLLRITRLPLTLENVWHEDHQLMGIHQWHQQLSVFHTNGLMRINHAIYMKMKNQ